LAVRVLLLMNSVATFFEAGLIRLMFFFTSGVHCPSTCCSIKLSWNYTVISCVNCVSE